MAVADIAIVTGASSGIGLRTVAALAADGWHVVATARDPAGSPELGAVAADHERVETAVLDVTDEASVDGAVARVLGNHGRVDLLVNNAGVGHRGTIEQLSVEEFAATMDVNFYGVVRSTKAVLPAMRAAGSGRIITVTSMNGVIGMPFSDAYNASKFAVEGLMEGLSPVASAFGIHVSVLEPGPVRTPFFTSMRGHTEAGATDDPYAPLLDTYNAGMRGMAQDGEDPADVAAVIAAIARDERPHLRYQSSTRASDLSGLKLVDTTGDSIVGVTRGLLGID
jgi:NAD(P)-dependent dehydrogenase (short-subunit alcohol dehydrogenase family)